MSEQQVHEEPHPYAGEVVPLSNGPDAEPAMFRVVDWADRVYGKPWRVQRGAVTWIYRSRAMHEGLPLRDDNVVLGKLLGVPFLAHSSEIEWSRL